MKNKYIIFLAAAGLIVTSCSGKKKTESSLSDTSSQSIVSSVSSDSTGSSSTSSEGPFQPTYKKMSKAEFDNAFSEETVSNVIVKGTQYNKYPSFGGYEEGEGSTEIRYANGILHSDCDYKGKLILNKTSSGLYSARYHYPYTYDSSSGVFTFQDDYHYDYYVTAVNENLHTEYYRYSQNEEYEKRNYTHSLESMRDTYGFIRLPYFGITYEDVLFDSSTGTYSLSKEKALSVLEQIFNLEIKDGYFTFLCGNNNKVTSFSLYASNDTTVCQSVLSVSDYGKTTLDLPENYISCEHNYNSYSSNDGEYHYTYCANCGSYLTAEKHVYDKDDGTRCSVCSYCPKTSTEDVLDNCCKEHITLEKSPVTGKYTSVSLANMTYSSEDIKDEDDNSIGTRNVYTCINDNACKLKIICEIYEAKIDDCHTVSSSTYKFYKQNDDESLTPLRDDAEVNVTKENHDYKAGEEVLTDACHGKVTYTCSKCNDSYTQSKVHHTSFSVTSDHGNNSKVVCTACGESNNNLRAEASSINEYAHQYYFYGYYNGEYLSKSVTNIPHTPSEDDPSVCSYCGQEDILIPLEESEDENVSGGINGYHFYYTPSSEGDMSNCKYFGMESSYSEDHSYIILTCNKDTDCGLRIEYEKTEEKSISSCVVRREYEYRFYKNDELFKTMTLVRYITSHELDETSKTVSGDDKGCFITTRVPCKKCDYVEETITENHVNGHWTTLDKETGLHNMYYGCINCHYNGEYYYSWYGHMFETEESTDQTAHDVNVSKCVCSCGEVIYDNEVTGGFSHSSEATLNILDNDLAIVKVNCCSDCGDFISLDVSSDVTPVTEGSRTTYTSEGNTLTIDYIEPEQKSYNENDCVKATYKEVVVIYNDEIIYSCSYLTDLTICHEDDCEKKVIYDDGYTLVYEYECGLHETVTLF